MARRTETVGIDKLVVGPDFQSLLNEPRVRSIAQRIAMSGEAHLPIVRAADMNVIAGEDIVAAFCCLGLAEMQVELVDDNSLDDDHGTEFSPHAATQCAQTEVTPVPPTLPDGWPEPEVVFEADSMTVEVEERGVARVEVMRDDQVAVLERVEAVPARSQAEAVRVVAAETGRTEAAVKKAVNRAKRAKDKVDIQCWGRPQSPLWMDNVSELRRSITTAANHMRTAMSTLSPLLAGAIVPGADLPGVYRSLKEQANALMRARPACVCLWCKNEPALREHCTACGGRGWLGEQAMTLAPRELLPPDAGMSNGKPVELSRYKAETHAVTIAVPADSVDESATKDVSEMTWIPKEIW